MPSKGQRRYTDDELRDAVTTSSTMREVLLKLGLRGRGGNYESAWHHIKRLGLDASHLEARRHSTAGRRSIRTVAPAELRAAVQSCRSVAETLRHLGVAVTSASRRAFRKAIEAEGIDTSHFKGQAWLRGSNTTTNPGRPLQELLRQGTRCRTSSLRRRLVKEGLKEARCEDCGNDEWQGRPIPLELDHANGDRYDNRLVNLRLLCPNCHALTDHYRGRNIGRDFSGQMRML